MSASIKIYGIRNCDTMKKASAWLDAHDIAYDFHDYKKLGVSKADVARWSDAAGWEKVLNRAGTTFRKLPEADRQDIDRDKAVALMVAYPSMIKRPVLDVDGRLEIGFKPERYAALFGK
jgi:Spx/MgsR family transcriptional regulator